MSRKTSSETVSRVSAQPRTHQRAQEMQEFGRVVPNLPLSLDEPVRMEMCEKLNQLLADTITIRDLYKKSHWQASGPTFYQLHLLYDKHYGEQAELVDTLAERIQILGGISLDAHEIIIRDCRELADRADKLGDQGTNDIAVSDVLRTNEMQVWFLSEHLVRTPLVDATSEAA